MRWSLVLRGVSAKCDADLYGTTASFVPQLGKPVLDLLPPPPKRVLDLGCGDGVLSAELLDRGYEVVGIDADERMVEKTRERNVEAFVKRGEAFDFEAKKFDCVFTNAAFHWMTDQPAVVRCVKQALGPNGVFVGECGGHGNIAALREAVRHVLPEEPDLCPWTFPTPIALREMLEIQGFRVLSLDYFDRPVECPDPADWLRTFGNCYFRDRDPEPVVRAFSDVAPDFLPTSPTTGTLMVDYVRLRWHAVL
ncbi:hypothetical protein CTAYLR_005125 [Chrysophaeum taylorii]|uniref:Uncharacterized protein n=1 Tax=Chrysophaeum taylorii TaxID=2483200 RepID=A0AAD7XM45_9STRA|nr:hypothetical protein CTAYLR_005125 [Chrysophaeum taylorii]